MKNKFTVIGIILTTVILAGVAIFTAMRLYQTREVAVAPNVPSSRPVAQEVSSCNLSFTITLATAPPTTPPATTAPPTTPPTTPPATASPVPQCNNSCTDNSQCPSGLMCYIPTGSTAGNCRNTQCLSEADCSCAIVTNPPTATSTSQAELPVVGTTWPTLLGTGFGILVIIGSLLLAL